ncbi:hypothetical protein HHK36_032061 [Tetracentron sinense]|uniref:Uncharacterized protein n=1 Tax=Tetracentron sinense TaxID=13715 RepID=A0A834Y642_TETSI|nr:hypothetical protein HHK36_032061 [Tetracentron sinense]
MKFDLYNRHDREVYPCGVGDVLSASPTWRDFFSGKYPRCWLSGPLRRAGDVEELEAMVSRTYVFSCDIPGSFADLKNGNAVESVQGTSCTVPFPNLLSNLPDWVLQLRETIFCSIPQARDERESSASRSLIEQTYRKISLPNLGFGHRLQTRSRFGDSWLFDSGSLGIAISDRLEWEITFSTFRFQSSFLVLPNLAQVRASGERSLPAMSGD